MGIRFRKYITVIPGVKINLSKSGVSATIGPKGASVNIGKNGAFINAGIPGTGIFMRERLSGTSGRQQKSLLSVEDITDIAREKVNELNEKAEEKLAIWKNLSHPMRYPVFHRATFLLEKPLPVPVPLPPILWGISAAIITFVLIASYTGSSEWAFVVSIIPACVGLFFSFKQKAQIDYQSSAKWQDEYDKWDADQKNLEEDFVAIIDCGKEEPEEALSVAFENIQWPYDTHISYQVDDDIALVDIDLPEIEELPDSMYIVRGRGRDKEIDTKAKTKIKLHEEYARHVHGIGVVVAATVFSTLLHVNTLVLSAFSQRKSKQTALTVDEYLYSVVIPRDEWTTLFDFYNSLSYQDPIDRLEHFDIRRNMSSSYTFKPIKPITIDEINHEGVLDFRYGFRGLKWGCPSSDIGERKEFDVQPACTQLYSRTKENLQWGGCELLQIFYGFCLDRLMMVEMQGEISNYKPYCDAISSEYGEPTLGDTVTQKLQWSDGTVLFMLRQNDGMATLNISSILEVNLMSKITANEIETKPKEGC